jgi:hypothetical protein
MMEKKTMTEMLELFHIKVAACMRRLQCNLSPASTRTSFSALPSKQNISPLIIKNQLPLQIQKTRKYKIIW